MIGLCFPLNCQNKNKGKHRNIFKAHAPADDAPAAKYNSEGKILSKIAWKFEKIK